MECYYYLLDVNVIILDKNDCVIVFGLDIVIIGEYLNINNYCYLKEGEFFVIFCLGDVYYSDVFIYWKNVLFIYKVDVELDIFYCVFVEISLFNYYLWIELIYLIIF